MLQIRKKNQRFYPVSCVNAIRIYYALRILGKKNFESLDKKNCNTTFSGCIFGF